MNGELSRATTNLILAELVDDGYVGFEDTDGVFVDTCLVCSTDFVTPEGEWDSDEWSYRQTFVSRELVEHMAENHDDILALVSMKVIANK